MSVAFDDHGEIVPCLGVTITLSTELEVLIRWGVIQKFIEAGFVFRVEFCIGLNEMNILSTQQTQIRQF